MATASPQAPAGWEDALLGLIHAPDTQANKVFLDTWHSFELSGATNNPLNTTQPEPGATDFNTVGVKNYPTASIGEQATATTLFNGYYPDLDKALASGNPVNYLLANEPKVAANLRKWGSGTFADALDKTAGTSGLPLTGSTTVTSSGGGSVSSGGGGPNVLKPFANVEEFLTFLASYRFLEILGGGVLILLGLYIVARQFQQTFLPPDPLGLGKRAVANEQAERTVVREQRTGEMHEARVAQTRARTTEIRSRSRARTTKARLTKEAAKREYNRGALDQATAEASPTMTKIRRQRSNT